MALPDDGYPVCVDGDPDSGDIREEAPAILLGQEATGFELVDPASKEPIEEKKEEQSQVVNSANWSDQKVEK